MKRLLLAFVALALLASPAVARQWTSRSGGFSIEAELLDVKDGNAVLKKADGSQVSVPLSKLSLGDMRYIGEVLKSAEAGITDVKGDAPVTEKKTSESAAQPDAPSIAPEVLKKLRYQWKKDQTYVYRVKITGERGYYSEHYAGDVTYKVKSVDANEIDLGMTAKLTRGERAQPVEVIIVGGPPFGPPFGGPFYPGRHVHVYSDNSNKEKEHSVTVTVDPLGRVDHIDGEWQLPYLVGDLSQLMIERLSDAKKSTWTVSSDSGVSVVTTYPPYYRFWGSRFREGVAATEKTVYTVQGEEGDLITLTKHYELTTPAEVAGKPRFEVTGDGRLVFDTARGLPASLDFRAHVTVRDGTKTEEVPVRITYRLIDDAEVAKSAKEAEEAKKEAEKVKRDKLRPLNDEEIKTALDDLASGDAERLTACLKLLGEKSPKEASPQIAKALESIMLNNENVGHRGEAAKAMKNWLTPESVPALMKALQDQWPPVRSGAIESLCKYKPSEAIKPIAALLPDGMTRGAAVKFLKAVGPDAEDVVLPHLENKDAWVRAEAVVILHVIGTQKSVPALEKAVVDESFMVNGNARKALPVVKARQ